MPNWIDQSNREYTGLNEENWSKAYNDRQIRIHKETAPLDHPDGSVTDEKIGTRGFNSGTFSFNGLLSTCLSKLGELINNAVTALNGEIAERKTADAVLQKNIDNESTARKNADTLLQGNITAESTARKNADDVLRGDFISLNGVVHNEITARKNEDLALQSRLDSEAGLRELEDNALLVELGLHSNNQDNPHSVTKEQVGLNHVLNIRQAAEQHEHDGKDILNGTITAEKLHSSITLGGVDESLAYDVFRNIWYLYDALGYTNYDGGYYFMPHFGKDLDGYSFGVIDTETVDFGAFEIMPNSPLPQVINGGGFETETITHRIDCGGFELQAITEIIDGGGY